jgi:hypothetical protein
VPRIFDNIELGLLPALRETLVLSDRSHVAQQLRSTVPPADVYLTTYLAELTAPKSETLAA